MENKNKLTRLLALASLTMLSSGCATYVIGVGSGGSTSGASASVSTTVDSRNTRSRPSPVQQNNARIRRQVRKILNGYNFNTRQIRISVNRGLVVMRGTVPSIEIERSIVRKISRVRGVHTVRSRLSISHR